MIRRYTHERAAAAASRQPPGYLQELMSHALTVDDEGLTIDSESPAYQAMVAKYADGSVVAKRDKKACTGVCPGSELKKLLARVGIQPKPGCACNARAAEMDAKGPDWCETNRATILEWLRLEAKTRPLVGVLYNEPLANLILSEAIKRARAATPSTTQEPSDVG